VYDGNKKKAERREKHVKTEKTEIEKKYNGKWEQSQARF
jgi:hypothetical protein